MSGKMLPIASSDIQQRIYTIRGLQVMLDRDIAELYEVKPIRLREQVKRNSNRFPADFMLQLTSEEVDLMVSQNAIPSKQSLGGSLPFAFTEQGVASVASVLTSDKAVETHILIMRAFVEMRKFVAGNALLFQEISSIRQVLKDHDSQFEQLFSAIEAKSITPTEGIFYNGQIFDAYNFASDLIRSAKKSIILIDNYIDDSVLTLLTKRKKNVTAEIFTKTISKQLQLDLKKHNEQYPEIKISKFNEAHDRFLIIDDKDLYHIGASLKDLGKKWFAFSKMEMGALGMIVKLRF